MTPHIVKVLISLVTIFIGVSKIKSTTVSKEPYQLSEFSNYEFLDDDWNGTWITDDCFYYKMIAENTSLVLFNAKNRSKSILIEYESLEMSNISSIIPSPDLQYLLIKYNESKPLRDKTTAKYKIIKLDNKEIYDVSESNILQLAKWSLEGHSLVYVFEFNLYYLANPEDAPNPRRLTYDGVSGKIHNGIFNENGVPLEVEEAFSFSSDGRYLAFLQFNLRDVGTSYYFIYGQPGSLENQYLKLEEMKYSKTGTAIPQTSVFIVDLEDPDSIPKEKKYQVPFENALIQSFAWPRNNEFSYVVSNRVQNKASVIRCPVEDVCYQESTYFEPNGWLSEYVILGYNRDGNTSVGIQAAPEGVDFYFHLFLTDLQNKNSTRLTFGKRTVLKILFWNEYENLIYYQSTLEDHPSSEHAYVIDSVTLEDICLTCNFSTPSGSCLSGTIVPSENASFFAKICNGPGPSYVEITDRKELLPPVIWIDNQELLIKLSKKLQPIQKDLLVPIADGYNARVRLYFPPEYNETSITKYPTLVYVYAGPEKDQISDKFDVHLPGYYWVTNKKYIYVIIDGRGSKRDGRNKMFEVYRRLGTVEIEDQINVTRYLQENIPGIDEKKTGIWGWSYGGFAAALAIAKDTTGIFKFGISVAPGTNFIYYQSVSYEKYLGLPTKDDNLEGYKNCDISAKAENFRGKSFLLIHGNADYNVHYQHSMILARALQKHDIPFQLMSYPDEDHNLFGVLAHLYLTMDLFVENQFKSVSN